MIFVNVRLLKHAAWVSDVVETVTSETETWRFETET